jgi:hypothetical protein
VEAVLDFSQHAPRSVKKDSVVVVHIPNVNDGENDQKRQEHSHVISPLPYGTTFKTAADYPDSRL